MFSLEPRAFRRRAPEGRQGGHSDKSIGRLRNRAIGAPAILYRTTVTFFAARVSPVYSHLSRCSRNA